MKRINFLTTFACIIVMCCMISSCTKENSSEISNDESQVNLDVPTFKNDLMIFSSIDAFYKHYEKIDLLYDTDYKAFADIANNQDLNSVQKLLANDIFATPEERYQPEIADPAMMAIVNKHFEFQIEEVLLTYVSSDFILLAHIDDVAARDQIRALPKYAKFDATQIPADTYLVAADVLETLLGPWGTVDYNPPVIEESNRSCEIEGSTGWDWKSNGIHGLSYRSQAYKTWCCTKEEARAFSKKWINNSWQYADTWHLYARVDAVRRSSGCNYKDEEHEVKTCSNCDHERARVSAGGKEYHYSSDVSGSLQKTTWENNVSTSVSGFHYVPF